MRSRSVRAGLAIALVVSLTACVETTRLPAAEPSPSVAPLFASDEEALAAATEAYEEYLVVVGEILRDGGANPERLRPLVSDEVYASELDGFNLFRESGYSAIGQSRLDAVQLQQHIVGVAGVAEVQIYVCVSIEETDVTDRSGQSVIDPNRPGRQAFEALFVSNVDGRLALTTESPWSGAGVCET